MSEQIKKIEEKTDDHFSILKILYWVYLIVVSIFLLWVLTTVPLGGVFVLLFLYPLSLGLWKWAEKEYPSDASK